MRQQSDGALSIPTADAITDLAFTYSERKQFDKAARLYDQAFAIYKKLNAPDGMAKVLETRSNDQGDQRACDLLRAQAFKLKHSH
jgi:hypothetical protein